MAIMFALRALIHNMRHVIIAAVALASMLVPVLFLDSIRAGVVEGLLADLRSDPAVLQVAVKGHTVVTPQIINALDELEATGFVVGNIRSLSSRMEMQPDTPNPSLFRVQLVPSAPGDPLLPDGLALQSDQIALVEELATEKGLAVDDGASLFQARADGSELEFQVTVAAVVPNAGLPENSVLVNAAVLTVLESFLEGFGVPDLGIPGPDPETRPESYSSLRLYAASIDDIVALDQAVSDLGLQAVSSADAVRWIVQLDEGMRTVSLLVGLVIFVGYLISIVSSMSAVVARLEHSLAMLRLMGAPSMFLFLFPMVFAGGILLAGLILAFGLLMAVSKTVNLVFAAGVTERAVSVLSLETFALASAASALTVIIVAAMIGIRAARIPPSEALRATL